MKICFNLAKQPKLIQRTDTS